MPGCLRKVRCCSELKKEKKRYKFRQIQGDKPVAELSGGDEADTTFGGSEETAGVLGNRTMPGCIIINSQRGR